MSKTCMDTCVSNPIPASQVVNVDVEWGDITPPECPHLNPSLQSIIDAIAAINNQSYDLQCLTPTENNTPSVVQALIDKDCSEPSGDSTNSTVTTVELDLNNCTTDNFNCDSTEQEICLDFWQQCDEPTLTSQLQAVINRTISLSRLNLLLCERVLTLENQVQELQLNNDCCDTSAITNRLTLLESNVMAINNNCC